MALGNGVDGAYPRFRARPPWWGADLQTLRNHLRRLAIPLDAHPAERLEFPMRDGSDDALFATLNRPGNGVAGDVPKPLVVLIHGLTGCEDSTYMRASARHLLERGHPVLRLNLRGAGPSRARCRLRYHAGRSEDLRTVIGSLDGRTAANGIVLVGFSLGGNMLLKYLGEQGRRAPILGAVSVSAPIDLKATQLRFMQRRNRRYHDHILARMKQEITLPDLEPAAVDAISSVYAFDDRVVAPRNGFAGADDYYARCSARNFLAEIRVPTLVIHARNDPWIPADPYLVFDWRGNPRLTPLLPAGGGHVGFHGLGSRVPWHDRCIGLFADRLAAVRAGRR
ncbi:MAG: YheT family hydrolase [Dongiaceae bacterium]